MSIIFHDGTMELYKRYSESKAWNDKSLLRLNSHAYNTWLHTFNTESAMKALLEDVGLAQCLFGGVGSSSVKDYVTADAEVASLVVLKGLHQFEDKWTKAHITLGVSGKLWHLYAQYVPGPGNGTMRFGTEMTAGETMSATTHDGFSVVGGGRKRRR